MTRPEQPPEVSKNTWRGHLCYVTVCTAASLLPTRVTPDPRQLYRHNDHINHKVMCLSLDSIWFGVSGRHLLPLSLTAGQADDSGTHCAMACQMTFTEKPKWVEKQFASWLVAGRRQTAVFLSAKVGSHLVCQTFSGLNADLLSLWLLLWWNTAV